MQPGSRARSAARRLRPALAVPRPWSRPMRGTAMAAAPGRTLCISVGVSYRIFQFLSLFIPQLATFCPQCRYSPFLYGIFERHQLFSSSSFFFRGSNSFVIFSLLFIILSLMFSNSSGVSRSHMG